jgi:hypothetical protein
MCLNETYSTVHIDKYFSDVFPIYIGPKHGVSNQTLFCKFVLEYRTTKVQENQEELELNRTH